MISKERIMVMIRLAMKEEEFGSEIKYNGPVKKEYVGGHMFMFFFVESLLYLFIVGAIFAGLFLSGNLNFPKDQLLLILGAILICYLLLTYIGLFLVRRSAIKKYKILKVARKEYKRELEDLHNILEDESRNL